MKAETHYKAALALDPTLVFAKRGKVPQHPARIAIGDSGLSTFSISQRLTTDSVLAEAVKLRDQGYRPSKRRDPGSEPRSAQLGDVINSVTTPVRVRLKSDNKTRVLVYRVGKLGTFEFKDLEPAPRQLYTRRHA